MESLADIARNSPKAKNTVRPKKNRYLHSADHLLADELSVRLEGGKHFGFYLKMASLYDHNWLRKLCGEVLESQGVRNHGRLFSYMVKKRNEELKK